MIERLRKRSWMMRKVKSKCWSLKLVRNMSLKVIGRVRNMRRKLQQELLVAGLLRPRMIKSFRNIKIIFKL